MLVRGKKEFFEKFREKYGQEPDGVYFKFYQRYYVHMYWYLDPPDAVEYADKVVKTMIDEQEPLPKGDPHPDIEKEMKEFRQRSKELFLSHNPEFQEVIGIVKDIKHFLSELECNYFDSDEELSDLSNYDKKMKQKMNETFSKLKRLSEILGE